MNIVYSVGYSLYGADKHVEALVSSSALLIDTRLVPMSWRPGWDRETLERKYGAKYRYAGNYLGNINYKHPEMGIVLKDAKTGIRGLVMYLREGYDLILLCQCPDYESCHRRVIADLLLAQLPEVQIDVYSPDTRKVLHQTPGEVQVVYQRVEQPALLDVPTSTNVVHFDQQALEPAKTKRTKMRR